LSVAHLLLNAVSYEGEIWHADAYRPSAGHVLGFMSIGVVVTKIITFFQKCGAVTSGRSVRPPAGSRPIPAGWLAGWLQQRAGPLQWRSIRVAISLAPACLL